MIVRALHAESLRGAPRAVEANAGAIPAEQTETLTQPLATIVVVPVNREPVSYAPPWEPDTTRVRRVRAEGPNTGPAVVFQRDLALAR
jgi:hypothetical protein